MNLSKRDRVDQFIAITINYIVTIEPNFLISRSNFYSKNAIVHISLYILKIIK